MQAAEQHSEIVPTVKTTSDLSKTPSEEDEQDVKKKAARTPAMYCVVIEPPKSTLETNQSLYSEAQLYLAESTMIYLYSAIRVLSATGHTTFDYHNICVQCSECDHSTEGRTKGQILLTALQELRMIDRNSGMHGMVTKVEYKESESDSSLLKALDKLIAASLKETGEKVRECALDGKPFAYEIDVHQHVGTTDQCLCTKFGLHYSQVLLDHLVISEKEKADKEAREKTLRPKSNYVVDMHAHWFVERSKPPTEEELSQNQQLTQKLASSSSNEDTLQWLEQQLRPESPLSNLIKHRTEIVFINDTYPDMELVYAVSVSSKEQKVVVTFRGTVNLSNWLHNFQAELTKRPNPIADEYPNKSDVVELHSGFCEYLLRKRLDNGSTKYDEIANKAHEFGKELGDKYRLVLTGHSLGGALSTIFGFYASCDDRFTKHGPVKIFSYASPRPGGTSFARAFYHQEQCNKLLHARFSHENDAVPRVPGSTKWHESGIDYVHTGVGIQLKNEGTKAPSVSYLQDFSFWGLFCKRIQNYIFFNLPWRSLFNIASFHELALHNEILALSASLFSGQALERSIEEVYLEFREGTKTKQD